MRRIRQAHTKNALRLRGKIRNLKNTSGRATRFHLPRCLPTAQAGSCSRSRSCRCVASGLSPSGRSSRSCRVQIGSYSQARRSDRASSCSWSSLTPSTLALPSLIGANTVSANTVSGTDVFLVSYGRISRRSLGGLCAKRKSSTSQSYIWSRRAVMGWRSAADGW